jgi:hypothetical protein
MSAQPLAHLRESAPHPKSWNASRRSRLCSTIDAGDRLGVSFGQCRDAASAIDLHEGIVEIIFVLPCHAAGR